MGASDSRGFIYYLMKGGSVVYIGQSVSLEPRIAQHKRDKDFDSVRFIEVSGHISLNDAEFSQIITHKPTLNVTLPEVSYLVSSAYVSKKIAKESKIDGEVSTGYNVSAPDVTIDLNGNKRNFWVNRNLKEYELIKYEIIDCLNNLVK